MHAPGVTTTPGKLEDVTKVGLKETRSLSSLYEPWYDPPWVCLNENIGKNHRSYNLLPEQCIPCHLTKHNLRITQTTN